jgi:hypothetical protein
MDPGFFSGIARGLQENPAATVAALAVVAMVAQFRVLMAQHKAQLQDRDKHQRAMDALSEKRIQDAQRFLPILDRQGTVIMVLEKSIDTFQSLSDFYRGTQTVVAKRPKLGGGDDER